MHQKLAPDPFLILLNNSKQTLHAVRSFENKKFWKWLSKSLLKSQLYFFFRTPSLLMNKVIKSKRGLELVISRSLKNPPIRYILSDQVWRCSVKQFLGYCKNYICKFMQVNQ